MTHFLFFLLFALAVAVCFGIYTDGAISVKLRQGGKIFAEFVGIGLLLAWICYFLPF